MKDPVVHAADLLARGYKEITEHGRLHVGQRVCHIGQRWPEARRDGTATVDRIFISPRIIQGREDVELIAKLDKPTFEDWPPYGYWADYHTVPKEAS